jgi:hypothetical protein
MDAENRALQIAVENVLEEFLATALVLFDFTFLANVLV